ncbi:class I SAM-dependent methyltransferase [Knoellia sp. S7-12]|uniref:class I SAM-dependent methyltransferase n=1 Tax=Knoellia sp. S7-12 TaxID=3126698 RepID=UPI003368AD6F
MPNCSGYLEIGVDWGDTFEGVRVPFRWGVDPYPNFNLRRLPAGARFSPMASDDFFRGLPPQHSFDLVFVDGLHEWRQTYRDVMASLLHIPPHGVIVLDDVVPDDEFASLPDQSLALELRRAAGNFSTRWQGDVYKVLLAILETHPEIEFRVIDGPHAQAVLWRRDSSTVAPDGQVEERLSVIDALKYADVFVEGNTPEAFRVVGETEAIETALAVSQATWKRRNTGP